MRDACAGLAFLHAQNPPLLHGDIKSLNMLIGTVQLAVQLWLPPPNGICKASTCHAVCWYSALSCSDDNWVLKLCDFGESRFSRVAETSSVGLLPELRSIHAARSQGALVTALSSRTKLQMQQRSSVGGGGGGGGASSRMKLRLASPRGGNAAQFASAPATDDGT